MRVQAAVRVSGLELGGLVGSLIAGRLSDYLIARNTDGKGGNVGKRVQVRGWVACTTCKRLRECMQHAGSMRR